MGASIFNEMEIDAIGEIMNISLGASATAISTLLGARVNITTPIVTAQNRDEFEFKDLDPAIGVEISYVEGLDGKNIMMFSRNDVRIIVGLMMGEEIPEDKFEMDEINASAIREVMNQMMGASATALSEFLGTTVNISTPVSYEIPDEQTFKDQNFPGMEPQVVVRFKLEINDKLSSEFLNIMSVGLVKKLLAPFAEQFGLPLDQEDYGYEAPEVVTGVPLDQITDEDRAAVGDLVHRPMDQSSTDELLNSMHQEESASSGAGGGGMLDQDAVNALLRSMQAGGTAEEELVKEEPEEMHETPAEDEDARAKAIFKDTKKTLTQEEMDEIFASMRAEMAQEEASAKEASQGGSTQGGAESMGQPVQASPSEALSPQPLNVSPDTMAASPMQDGAAAPASAPAQAQSATASPAPSPAGPQVQPQYQQPYYAQPIQVQSQPDPMLMQLISQMQQSQNQMLSQMQQSQNQMMDIIKDMREERQRKDEKKSQSDGGSFIRPLNSRQFEDEGGDEQENEDNREMLMKVPLEISVEIGRTKKLVKDILEFTQGSLVVLDKMAGEQADLYVNGECIARGDIVVVEDNFGIRITEILKKDINEESL